MRVASNRRVVFKSGEEGFIHTLGGSVAVPVLPPPRRPVPVINHAALLADFQAATTGAMYNYLARSLGVSVFALRQLGACYASRHKAWAFPMRDGAGGIIGIRLRADNGSKWCIPGGHNGLFVPEGSCGRRIYICEGPTDTAAALSIDLYAIGRPSCSGGVDFIVELVRRRGITEAVIIGDNDDEDERGNMPGVNGAVRLQELLPVRSAVLVLPCKDIREFVRQGGTAPVIHCLLSDVLWKSP